MLSVRRGIQKDVYCAGSGATPKLKYDDNKQEKGPLQDLNIKSAGVITFLGKSGCDAKARPRKTMLLQICTHNVCIMTDHKKRKTMLLHICTHNVCIMTDHKKRKTMLFQICTHNVCIMTDHKKRKTMLDVLI